MNQIKLICLPFAGGSKYAYQKFIKLSPDWMDVVPLDLAGRGSRINEKPMTVMGDIVEDILEKIVPIIDQPYAIYGHSMGALTTLLLVREIRKRGLPMPMHIFVTGHGGPSTSDKKIVRYNMEQKDLVSELKALDGMPEEVLKDKVLLDYCLPIIRADFEAIETYEYEEDEPLDVAITCVIGREEQISLERAESWKVETNLELVVKQYPGKHFFIFNYEQELIQLICKTLDAQLQGVC